MISAREPRRGRWAWVVLACLATGCVTRYRVVIDGPSLHQQSAALRTTGRATLEAIEVAGDDEAWRMLPETITIDQRVRDGGRTRWVRDLLRGCADDTFDLATNPDCELVTRTPAEYELRRYQTRSVTRFTRIVIGGGLAVGLIAALGCSGICPDGTWYETASNVTAAASGALLVGMIVWAVISCSGRWGSPGCRD